MSRRQFENISAIIVLTVFMGQIYISPFDFGFRLTFAVVALSLFLIYFKSYNSFKISCLVGVFMILFRSGVSYLGDVSVGWWHMFNLYSPVIMFYIVFGALFTLLEVRAKLNKPIPFMLSLWVCDSVGNIVEALSRKSWTSSPFDDIILAIILMGGVRTVITYLVYWISNYYVKRFKNDQKEKYYRELVLFTAKLKTELFFLKKSKNDIEEAMSLSHRLYESSENSDLKPELLKIAKDIHEIKKDYSRVILGMESTLNSDSAMKFMSLEDIIYMVRDNAVKIVAMRDKKIEIQGDVAVNRTVTEYYAIISILNNLVINAVDAIDQYGTIQIKVKNEGESVVLTVADDGKGIVESNFESVFDAGYSTKYDKSTGEMSTGIGLTHVRQIINNQFQGVIHMASELNVGTTFTIRIPKNRL